LLTKDIIATTNRFAEGFKSLPIQKGVKWSCLDVVKFLHKAYPESISMLGVGGKSLLHIALSNYTSCISDATAKVQYLCDQCPALIRLEDCNGDTVLHMILAHERFNFGCVKILCNVDATVVRNKRSPATRFGQLPLHCLIEHRSIRSFREMSEVSQEADCFRLFLVLYPAAAGIRDGHLRSPYDLAVSNNLRSYFIRLLLSADPTIDPVQRQELNFAARRQGMFLAFRALSSDIEPTIWTKMRLKGRDLLEYVISYL
jgi:hypothetical protein